MESYFGGLEIPRLIFVKGLSAIYFVAFLGALNQFIPLLGKNGLLPATDFIKQTTFRITPGIFHLHYSDRFFKVVASAGLLLSVLLLTGIADNFHWVFYILTWLLMWFLYLSIVNVGQTFYSFGWESMLLEAGFFAAFMGPDHMEPSIIPVILLRWMLFRVEFGAGLIKLRHDPCWRDYTCLYYHYETQPLPGPLSWHFHHFPKSIHRFGVMFSHFVQLIVPFGVFAPQPVAQVAALLIIGHQLWLVLCGNYAWLNWLTIVLAFVAFSDSLFPASFINHVSYIERPVMFNVLLYALLAVSLVLSWKPLLNFFSRDQLMNYCYNPIHLVCVYGAFGSVTKERYEVIIEGTTETNINERTIWKEYQFRGKPGRVTRIPGQFAPYHLRLDWSMWFLPFSVVVSHGQILNVSTRLWFIRFIEKLLEGNGQTLSLLADDPFKTEKPSMIRVQYYKYQLTTEQEKQATGAIWKRAFIGDYLEPVSRNDIRSMLN